MTTLRQRMLDDMRLRNLSERTQSAYLRNVAAFAKFFATSPDRLGPEHARTYLLHLLDERHLSPSTLNVVHCSLRFFYRVTLRRA